MYRSSHGTDFHDVEIAGPVTGCSEDFLSGPIMGVLGFDIGAM